MPQLLNESQLIIAFDVVEVDSDADAASFIKCS